jgi:hypothetical protein
MEYKKYNMTFDSEQPQVSILLFIIKAILTLFFGYLYFFVAPFIFMMVFLMYTASVYSYNKENLPKRTKVYFKYCFVDLFIIVKNTFYGVMTIPMILYSSNIRTFIGILFFSNSRDSFHIDMYNLGITAKEEGYSNLSLEYFTIANNSDTHFVEASYQMYLITNDEKNLENAFERIIKSNYAKSRKAILQVYYYSGHYRMYIIDYRKMDYVDNSDKILYIKSLFKLKEYSLCLDAINTMSCKDSIEKVREELAICEFIFRCKQIDSNLDIVNKEMYIASILEDIKNTTGLCENLTEKFSVSYPIQYEEFYNSILKIGIPVIIPVGQESNKFKKCFDNKINIELEGNELKDKKIFISSMQSSLQAEELAIIKEFNIKNIVFLNPDFDEMEDFIGDISSKLTKDKSIYILDLETISSKDHAINIYNSNEIAFLDNEYKRLVSDMKLLIKSSAEKYYTKEIRLKLISGKDTKEVENIRSYDLMYDLNISLEELIKSAKSIGIKVVNPATLLSADDRDYIYSYYERMKIVA